MYRQDDKLYYSWYDYSTDMKKIPVSTGWPEKPFNHVVGIYRGSLGMATHISNVFEVPMSIVGFQTRDGKDKEPHMIYRKGGLKRGTTNILVVDDIYDSGYTMDRVMNFLSHPSIDQIQGFCLFGKENKLNVSYANKHDGTWIVFPWETINESF